MPPGTLAKQPELKLDAVKTILGGLLVFAGVIMFLALIGHHALRATAIGALLILTGAGLARSGMSRKPPGNPPAVGGGA